MICDEKAAADAEAISRLRHKWDQTAAKVRQVADFAVSAISIYVIYFGGNPGSLYLTLPI